jgi:hypothetical protein
MNEVDAFSKTAVEAVEKLFQAAKAQDEFAYVFALLGINSGIEDAGWQPINETRQLMRDIVSIVNTPLEDYTKMRLLLLMYCQITEASYLYHVLYNMLLTIEFESPPKVFSFLEQYRKGVPPSVKSKVQQICDKAVTLGHPEIKTLLNATFHAPIRNAVSHADFILYGDKLRLKHTGREIMEIPADDVVLIINKMVNFFDIVFMKLQQHRTSYQDGYVIRNRKNKAGMNLSSVTLSAHPQYGVTGFSTSDPLPIW